MDFVTLAILALATARVTRLITSDRVTASLRAALVRKAGATSRLTYLIHCDWCVGMYVGTGAAVAWHFLHGNPYFDVPMIALGLSYFTGYMASRMED